MLKDQAFSGVVRRVVKYDADDRILIRRVL